MVPIASLLGTQYFRVGAFEHQIVPCHGSAAAHHQIGVDESNVEDQFHISLICNDNWDFNFYLKNVGKY